MVGQAQTPQRAGDAEPQDVVAVRWGIPVAVRRAHAGGLVVPTAAAVDAPGSTPVRLPRRAARPTAPDRTTRRERLPGACATYGRRHPRSAHGRFRDRSGRAMSSPSLRSRRPSVLSPVAIAGRERVGAYREQDRHEDRRFFCCLASAITQRAMTRLTAGTCVTNAKTSHREAGKRQARAPLLRPQTPQRERNGIEGRLRHRGIVLQRRQH